MSLRTALGPRTHQGAVRAASRAQPAPRCASNRAVPSASMPRLVASRGIITASPSSVSAAPLSPACSAPGGRQTLSCSAAPAVVLASTEEGEAVGTTILSSVPDPPGLLYEALLALHSTTGLGWASTLIVATMIMRLSLLPLSLYADRNSRKVSTRKTRCRDRQIIPPTYCDNNLRTCSVPRHGYPCHVKAVSRSVAG